MIYDVILCVALICAFIIGMRRGLLRSVWGLAALILSIILTSIIHPMAINSFKKSAVGENINNYVSEKIAENASEVGSEIYVLPDNFTNEDILNFTKDNINTAAIVEPVINVAGAVILFVFIRILLAVIYNILKVIFSFPVLKQTNKLAGGLVQTIIALTAVYALLAIIAVSGSNILNDTVICKTMYENNILISIVAHT